MNISQTSKCIHLAVDFVLRTGLLLRSGEEGDFSDNIVERTADGRLHVNGYVWASLLRRALDRLEGTEKIVERIGRYGRDEQGRIDNLGVSPLWCATTIGMTSGDDSSDIRPGNRIDRKWGSAAAKALYSEEMENPGGILTLAANYFCGDGDNPDEILRYFLAALTVVDEGIENIGGGWSYGCGRLKTVAVRGQILDLKQPSQRRHLWDFNGLPPLEIPQPNSSARIRDSKGWTTFRLVCAVEPGQILAIHSAQPNYDYGKCDHLPDAFVFRTIALDEAGVPKRMPVITGKAFRQAVLSAAIERRLRTMGRDICANPGERCTCGACTSWRREHKTKEVRTTACACARCRWFGATDQGGIIAVLDAPIRKAECQVLHRIQLCEHSFQNIQLFSGEYLTGGEFDIEIIIDEAQGRRDVKEEFIPMIRDVLGELGPEKTALPSTAKSADNPAPPGWYRLGATTTCTGQFSIKEWEVRNAGR